MTDLFVVARIAKLIYTCPHCKKTIRYETDSLPAKKVCANCLKRLSFRITIIKAFDGTKSGMWE